MEAFLDKLANYLATDPHGKGTAAVTWILGDTGTSELQTWPVGYITPFNDEIQPLTGGVNGVDKDTYLVPLFIVDDLHRYGEPVQTQGQQYMEQPGYRSLLQYAQAVRAAVRANITLDGVIATSRVIEIRYVQLKLAERLLRAARVTIQAQQRRGR
jgi:hypothetical protein